ncbi:MAG: N-acetylmuramoyl-L-alanine amidase [Eubacteriales bacterium]
MKKRCLGILLIVILVIQQFSYVANANEDNNELKLLYDGEIHNYNNSVVRIQINGQEVQTGDMPGIIIVEDQVGRTLVPAREVFETIGAEVEWKPTKEEIYITYKDTFIRLKINSQEAFVNDKKIMLDVPAKLVQDTTKEYAKTMVPFRFVGEALDYEVDWDSNEYIAIINEKENNDSGEDSSSEEELDVPISEDEMINELDGTGAKRPLPTPLAENLIKWNADNDLLSNFIGEYVKESITEEKHSTINVKDIEHNDELNKFKIVADGPISSVKETEWEDKIILDIKNAKNDISSSKINLGENNYIKSIRSSQFKTDPLVTRVVFDINGEKDRFNIELSEDRKEITVNVLNNILLKVETGQNNKGDFVKLLGLEAPEVKVFRLSNPNRLVIDLPNTLSSVGYKLSLAEGQYIKEVRTAQFNETISRVVLETDGQADYIISEENNSTTIQIIEPGFQNIKYENHKLPNLVIRKPDNVTLEDINIKDLYLNKEIVLEIKGNHTSLYGNGLLGVYDGQVEKVNVSLNRQGNTEFRIKNYGIFAADISEDENNIFIELFKPKDKYSQIIVIDPGHGGKDPGASHNGLIEKELNLEIVNYVKMFLDMDDNIKTYYTRLDDTYPSLQERVELANEVEADIFLSVHNNAYYSNFNGTETLYFPQNETSGLDSAEFASILQEELVNDLKLNDRGLKERTNLFVLKNTNMPAALVEIGFISSSIDSEKLKEEEFKQRAAIALYKAITRTFDDFPTKR